MPSLVSQRKQACYSQCEALEDTLTDQHIICIALLHIGNRAEHNYGPVLWLDNPHPLYTNSEILDQFLPYVLPPIVRRHDFDHQVWCNLEKAFGRTVWPAL